MAARRRQTVKSIAAVVTLQARSQSQAGTSSGPRIGAMALPVWLRYRGGSSAKPVCKPHSVIGNHLSWPAGCPAALCALPGARRAASTPRFGLLRVEFDPFHPLPPRCRTGRRDGGSSSLCHLSSPHGGRALPATLLYGVRTFLAPGHWGTRPRDCPTDLAPL